MEQSIPIGERIAAQRRRRGLSQAQLAHRLGRSEQWLSNIERGVRPADRYSLLNAIAGELRVPLTELTGEAPRLVRDPAEQHLAVHLHEWGILVSLAGKTSYRLTPGSGTAVGASSSDQQPPALSRREAFQDWSRGLGRLVCDLLGLDDPEARLQRPLAQIPEMTDQQLQELAQPAMALRQTRLYAAANLEQLCRLQRRDQERLRQAELEWQQRWGLRE